jgi:hypothetical protein
VKIFLDECVDWRSARDIIGRDVKTARQMRWTAIKHRELLTLAPKHFDVFVTTGSKSVLPTTLTFIFNRCHGV